MGEGDCRGRASDTNEACAVSDCFEQLTGRPVEDIFGFLVELVFSESLANDS